MANLAFYLVALPLTGNKNNFNLNTVDLEFTEPANGYSFEILKASSVLDSDGNMPVTLKCIETQEEFETTYDPHQIVSVN